MPKLIKQGTVIDDDWTLIKELADDAAVPSGRVILPLSAFEARRDALADQAGLGVWLDSDEAPSRLQDALQQLAVIAINFPAFTDGRGYSYAQLLRQRYDYRGEIRAVGDVLRDQLFYMKRCGFDAFALRADQDPSTCLAAFNDFSDCYQAAADQPSPLFRRRALSQ